MTKWDVYNIIEDTFKWLERYDTEGISQFYYDYDKDDFPVDDYDGDDLYNENRKKFFEILKNAIDKYEEK